MTGGTVGMIDLLSYTYSDALRPDRLTKMADGGDGLKGFKRTNSLIGDHYIYDANGNMTQDKHKSLTMSFNFLNLPQSFTLPAGNITMTYTADGEKLTKVAGATTKNYISGIEYTGANLEAIYFSEGRCTPNGATAFFYDYTVKDHLGNARVNFRATGASITYLEQLHYYPFGMLIEGLGTVSPTNDYAYNGKELNEDFDLNLSDYGARWYDAAVGRWWNVEPLTGCFSSQSGYAYGGNNPVSTVDVYGLLQFPKNATINIEGKTLTYEQAFPEFTKFLKGGTASDGTRYGLAEFLKSSDLVTAGLKVFGGYTNESILQYISTWGAGITINIINSEKNGFPGPEFNGETTRGIEKLFSGEELTGEFTLDIIAAAKWL